MSWSKECPQPAAACISLARLPPGTKAGPRGKGEFCEEGAHRMISGSPCKAEPM